MYHIRDKYCYLQDRWCYLFLLPVSDRYTYTNRLQIWHSIYKGPLSFIEHLMKHNL